MPRVHPRRVVAGMATIANRSHLLLKVIASIAPQVDELVVYANDWGPTDGIPAGALPKNVRLIVDRPLGDLGDNGKLYGLEMLRARGDDLSDVLYVCCDDDIVYPPDFVARVMPAARTEIWGVHGIRIIEPIATYYRSRRTYNYVTELPRMLRVSALGTGAVAFWAEAVGIRLEHAPVPNMLDVWMAIYAKAHGIVMRAVPRAAGWLEILPAPHTIYDRARHDDWLQTLLVKGASPWPQKM